jgi:hypothetical protein
VGGVIMKNKMSFLTQTIQPRSWTPPDEEKNLHIVKPEEEDNMSLMFSIIESLNKLNEKLKRLESLIDNKIRTYSISENETGNNKEQQ